MPYGPPTVHKLTGGLSAIGVLIAGALAPTAFAGVGSVKGEQDAVEEESGRAAVPARGCVP